jgi:adenosine deaminase
MPALLCTLGKSWAVVPEAFLLGNGEARYESVLVVTTDSDATRRSLNQVRTWFRDHCSDIEVRLLAIEHLSDLSTSEDHLKFEEGFYRAYFELLRERRAVHVCLAGGFKTMSAAAHEAAGLLGCENLFHLTVPHGVSTENDEEIFAAISNDEIHLISLGSRMGWPTILELVSDAPHLPDGENPFLVDDFTLAHTIHNRMEAASRLAASEGELAVLPFPQIARWAPGERAWLNQPLDAAADKEWLMSMPKVDLHCHLGGFATHGDLLAMVRAASSRPDALPPVQQHIMPLEWPAAVLTSEPNDRLRDYMNLGNNTGTNLLRDPGCLAEHCRLFYEHLRSQHVVYAEIRCSPANYASADRSPWTVLSEIKACFDACMRAKPGCHVNLIIIATRREKGDFRTDIGRHLTLAVTAAEHWRAACECRIVGVDLAGFEDINTRAHYFREEFKAAHRCGLALTVHAGENDDAEGIWSAVFDLNARRIGHALSLGESKDLLRAVADRRIGVEMCPYANLQIKGFPLDAEALGNPRAYPLLRYMEAGIPVTINTDNIGISAASLTDNFLLLPRLCPGITRLQVLQLVRNGIDQSFLANAEKHALLAGMRITH